MKIFMVFLMSNLRNHGLVVQCSFFSVVLRAEEILQLRKKYLKNLIVRLKFSNFLQRNFGDGSKFYTYVFTIYQEYVNMA